MPYRTESDIKEEKQRSLEFNVERLKDRVEKLEHELSKLKAKLK